MSRILCSTGALLGMPNGRDFRLLPSIAEQLSCDGFEFMMYGSWYGETDSLVDVLVKSGLDFPVMHLEKRIGEKISLGGPELADAFARFEKNCEIALKIGAGKLVMHLWDGLTSDAYFENNREAYGKLRAIADSHGLELLVENVVCNGTDPMKHWKELRECYPDIRFIFDTKMAAFHGQLELLYEAEWEWLWKEGHLRHFHINDYAGGYKDWPNLRTLPMGKGHIDFERFFGFVRKTGYNDTFTVESTALSPEGVVDAKMLNGQFRRIRELLEQKCNICTGY